MNNEGYQPAREPGEIVPLKALVEPKVFSPAFEAANKPAKELQGFRLVWCSAGMGDRPYQILHVSEMGKIAFKYPEKAVEVITGAIPTVPVGGFVFIESTFEGGKGGEFYKLIVKAMEMIGRDLGPLDLKFHFFPWYSDQGYRSEGTDEPSLKTFFSELQKQGVQLDSRQRAW